MAGIDKATGRVAALIVLLMLTGAALRGYLPPAGHAVHRPATQSPAVLVVVVGGLVTSLAIVTVAIIHRMRNRRSVAGSIGDLSTGASGDAKRPSWRVLLIGLALILLWLLIGWLLTRLVGQHRLDGVSRRSEVSAGAPATARTSATSGTGAHPEQPPQNPTGDGFRYLSWTVVAMLLAGMGVVVAVRYRRTGLMPPGATDEYPEPDAARPGPQSLARAAELGLAEIGDLTREPREAIIACYATMERQLGNVPDAAPQDFDTPSEVLARAVQHHVLRSDNATRLVNLFAEARFSPHLMTEQHRDDAVRILRLVLDELRSPA